MLESIQGLIKLGRNTGEDVDSYFKYLQYYLLDVLKSSHYKSFEGMYGPKILYSNETKLKSYYQRKLNHDDPDKRFFIRERMAHTPGKLTPFARQGAANKLSPTLGMKLREPLTPSRMRN